MDGVNDRVEVLARRFTVAELVKMSLNAALAGHRVYAESCRQAIAEKIVKER